MPNKTRSLKKTPASISQWEKLGARLIKDILQVLDFGASTRVKPRVELRIVGSAPMIRLNRAWRKKNKVTDVLSFSAPEIFRTQGHLGELVVCLPVLKKQAKDLRHSPEAELQILLVHGVLHLLGMDHEGSKKAAREMARWEANILAELYGSTERAVERKGLIQRSS